MLIFNSNSNNNVNDNDDDDDKTVKVCFVKLKHFVHRPSSV